VPYTLALGVAVALSLPALAMFPSSTAVFAAPAPLTGEFLGSGSTSGDGGTLVTAATCSQTSPSTISFTASGTAPASDPYPGTFSESGVITVSTTPTGSGVNGIPLYQVSALDEFFTINSAAGNVTGIKHLSEFGAGGVSALCSSFDNQAFGNSGDTVTGYDREVINAFDGFGESYDAIIATPSGSFEDTGISGVSLQDLDLSAQSGPTTISNANFLNAAFRSSSLTPVSTQGDATGGGQISPSGNPIVFGFEARSENGLHGQCDVVDQSANVKLHCTDATSFAQLSATEVEFFGDATVNGVATTYAIDTQDLAESGAGADPFSISTGSGYSIAGTLSRGNVQIHN
jgi:hypothetical protein